MTNEPADVSEAGRSDDKRAPVGLPAEPIDTNPAGNPRPSERTARNVPATGDDRVEQGTAGSDE